MTKLAIVYPAHYEQSMGGAELQIYYLAKYAKQNGLDVFFIFVDRGTKIENTLGLHLFPMAVHPKISGLGPGWFLYGLKLRKILNQIKPEIIYTRHGSSWIYYAARYAQTHRVAYFHALSADKITEKKFCWKLLAKPEVLVENLLIRAGLKRTERIITQNLCQQESVRRIFHREGFLVNQMTPVIAEGEIVKPISPIQILWIANFKQLKRPELFLELVERWHEYPTATPCQFIMMGRASQDYKEMLAQVQRVVPEFHYLGEVSQAEVGRYLSNGHILVNTSLYEGFSNTFVQAWMCRVPVVSMNSDPNEILQNHKIGFLAPTPALLFAKVKQLIENRVLREAMGTQARDYVLAHHSLDKNMPQLLDLLQKTL